MSDLTNKKFRLQILNHEDVFDTRESALKYIDDNLKYDVLLAEPAIVFYGDETAPNAILAIGSGKRTVYTIDLAKVEEDLKVVKDNSENSSEEIDKAVKTIDGIIEKCGLFLNENKITDQVEYPIDKKDVVIGDAESLAEAINLLSKKVQEIIGNSEFATTDTNSVKLTFKENEDGKKTLKAKVKISDDGDSDEKDFNNNILGVKSDGLYAAVHLEYDDLRNELTFYSSGMKDGRFQDDAKGQVIKLGKHTKVTTDSNNHNVKLTIDSENVISGDVKIDESRDGNILKSSDGGIYVEGKAKNIKYKGTTVADALTKVDENIAELNKKVEDFKEIEISGDETDTLNITTKKDKDGDYTISGDVRLNSNKSIIVLDGGLSVNMDVNVDVTQNKLVLRVGNTTKEVFLPGVAIFDEAKYDPATKVIVIKFKDGSKINIPVGDLFPADSYGLKHNDTSVGAKLDELDVKDASIIQDLIGEINDRKAQAETIISKIEQETKDREHADEDIKHLLDDLKEELDITDIKEELKKFEEGYTKFEGEWEVYKDQIKKAISDAEAVSGRVSELEKRIEVTDTNVGNLNNRVIAVEGLNDKVNGLSESITSTNGDVSALKDRVATAEENINNNASKIAENTLAITNEATLARQNENDIKTSLESEITRSTAKDEELASNIVSNKSDIETAKTNITSLQNDLTAEVERAKGVENTINETLSNVKSTAEQNKTDITTNLQKLNDEIIRATSKETEIEGKLNDEVTRAQGEEKRLDEKIKELNDTSFAAVNNAIEQSKNYTDAEVLKAKTASAEDATAKANQALSDAKTYSDEKLVLEIERAKSAEQTNADAIIELKAKDTEIEANVANKVGSVRVEKNSQSDLQYILYVDDKPAGEINIPKDQFLKDVRYDVGTKSLVFTWELPDHPKTSVDVSDFLTTYVAGDGLLLTENVFSVKLTTANESYLQVTTDGIQLVGIDAKFDTKADRSDVYRKLEVDNAVEAEAIRAKGVENGLQNAIDTTNGKVTELTGRVADAEGKLNIIQGNSAQEGSIEYALAKANEYAEGLAGGEQSRAEMAEKEIAENAKSYTDGKAAQLEPRVSANESAIVNLNGTIADTLRESKEYTDTKINEVNTKVDGNTLEITQIKKDVASLEPNVTGTDSVKMTMNKTANGTTFSSDVKLDLKKSNILKISRNGLYAEVSLSYDTAENKLVFVAGGLSQDIQLAGASMLEDAYYNSATRQIVFVVKTQAGETKQVTVDVNDLINTLRVENPANSPVQLTLTQDAQGNDLLSANLIISTKEDNAILSDNGTLFASKRAANMTGLWENELDTNLQVIINNLKARTDGIEGLKSDVDGLKTDMNEAKINIANIQGQLTNIDIKVETLTNTVSDLAGRVAIMESDIKKLQDVLGNESGGNTIFDRLTKLEQIVENLIDFGEYID